MSDSLDTIEKSASAINAVNDLLAGGRVLKSMAQLLAWIGGIVAGVVAFKLWILK
jgi:adenine/guanine phosphoribosyltransferase-like PRPP-binding protein